MVELGVVQAAQQAQRPGAGGGQADPDPAGGLGVPGGHEGGRLLVVDQHQPDPVAEARERLDHPVGAVGRQPEDGVDPPVDQPADQQVRGELPHQAPSPSLATVSGSYQIVGDRSISDR